MQHYNIGVDSLTNRSYNIYEIIQYLYLKSISWTVLGKLFYMDSEI